MEMFEPPMVLAITIAGVLAANALHISSIPKTFAIPFVLGVAVYLIKYAKDLFSDLMAVSSLVEEEHKKKTKSSS